MRQLMVTGLLLTLVVLLRVIPFLSPSQKPKIHRTQALNAEGMLILRQLPSVVLQSSRSGAVARDGAISARPPSTWASPTVYVVYKRNGSPSGGPESLHQLHHALLAAAIPSVMVYGLEEYRSSSSVYAPEIPWALVERGDIFVAAEGSPIHEPELTRLRRLGAHFATYYLGQITWDLPSIVRQGTPLCISAYFQHMYGCAARGVLPVPMSAEYVTQTAEAKPGGLEQPHRRLVLLDSDVANDIAAFLRAGLPRGLGLVRVEGFSRPEVAALLRQALVVVDTRLPGMERLGLEGVLSGACAVFSASAHGRAHSDLPVPEEYRVETHDFDAILHAVTRCASSFQAEARRFEPLRELHRSNFKLFVQRVSAIFRPVFSSIFCSCNPLEHQLTAASILSTLLLYPMARIVVVTPERDAFMFEIASVVELLTRNGMWSQVHVVLASGCCRDPMHLLENRREGDTSMLCFMSPGDLILDSQLMVDVASLVFFRSPRLAPVVTGSTKPSVYAEPGKVQLPACLHARVQVLERCKSLDCLLSGARRGHALHYPLFSDSGKGEKLVHLRSRRDLCDFVKARAPQLPFLSLSPTWHAVSAYLCLEDLHAPSIYAVVGGPSTIEGNERYVVTYPLMGLNNQLLGIVAAMVLAIQSGAAFVNPELPSHYVFDHAGQEGHFGPVLPFSSMFDVDKLASTLAGQLVSVEMLPLHLALSDLDAVDMECVSKSRGSCFRAMDLSPTNWPVGRRVLRLVQPGESIDWSMASDAQRRMRNEVLQALHPSPALRKTLESLESQVETICGRIRRDGKCNVGALHLRIEDDHREYCRRELHAPKQCLRVLSYDECYFTLDDAIRLIRNTSSVPDVLVVASGAPVSHGPVLGCQDETKATEYSTSRSSSRSCGSPMIITSKAELAALANVDLSSLTTLERAYLDLELSARAHVFFGNFYSSFSFMVKDLRRARKAGSSVYLSWNRGDCPRNVQSSQYCPDEVIRWLGGFRGPMCSS